MSEAPDSVEHRARDSVGEHRCESDIASSHVSCTVSRRADQQISPNRTLGVKHLNEHVAQRLNGVLLVEQTISKKMEQQDVIPDFHTRKPHTLVKVRVSEGIGGHVAGNCERPDP
jgi:hypothetical protein